MPRYRALQLYELCSLPRLPSAYIGMPEAGYTPRQCMDFDWGVVSFATQFARWRQEQELVDVPRPSRNRRHQEPRFVHDREAILMALDIDPALERAGELLGEFVDEAMFDALDDDEA